MKVVDEVQITLNTERKQVNSFFNNKVIITKLQDLFGQTEKLLLNRINKINRFLMEYQLEIETPGVVEVLQIHVKAKLLQGTFEKMIQKSSCDFNQIIDGILTLEFVEDIIMGKALVDAVSQAIREMMPIDSVSSAIMRGNLILSLERRFLGKEHSDNVAYTQQDRFAKSVIENFVKSK